MLNDIIAYNNKLKTNIDIISQNSQETSFTFNTGELIPFAGKGSEKACPVWQRLWWPFKQIQSPVVYWFQMDEKTDPQLIFNTARTCKISQYVTQPNFRHLPAMHETCPPDSKTLYVGCCAFTTILDRMFWHFGYYVTGKTQGLQLCHWSRSLNIPLTLHVLSFPKEAIDFIYVYEKLIARQLRPIIGK